MFPSQNEYFLLFSSLVISKIAYGSFLLNAAYIIYAYSFSKVFAHPQDEQIP